MLRLVLTAVGGANMGSGIAALGKNAAGPATASCWKAGRCAEANIETVLQAVRHESC